MRSRGQFSLGVILVSGLLASSLANAAEKAAKVPDQAKPEIDFATQIQPIFATHCAACHGSKVQRAGLRLDDRASALQGGDSGPAFVAGKPEESEVLRRVLSQEDGERMPPPGGKNQPLSPEQIALLTRWIEQGANWPDTGVAKAIETDHWAYQPLSTSEPPTVKDSSWVRSPIDNFILARLEDAGIPPSPEADRTTLIKRLYYDLLGLPPSPREVDEFLSDTSADAYERLVDRLLRSPHFGERWGRHWLDKARYADSDGYEKDRARPHAWYYRDWVIKAVNSDMPFDQFTIEQLAGDLLPGATRDQRLATAFHRQTLTNTEGGVDQEQFRNEALFDRVATTGTVWLGLTIGCAQCHTHKYDQITQAEYYQLFAFFNNGDEANMEIARSEEAVAQYQVAKAAYDQKLKDLEQQIAERRATFAASKLAEWEAAAQKRLAAQENPARLHPLEIVSVESSAGAEFRRLEDGSILTDGDAYDQDVYTITARTNLAGLTALRLDVLSHQELPSNGPGCTPHGNFVLNEFRVEKATNDQFAAATPVSLKAATADFSQSGWPVAAAIDNKPETGWAISPQMGKDHYAVFECASPLGDGNETVWLRITLTQQYGSQHTIGRFRLQARTGVESKDSIPADVQQILAVPADQRTEKQKSALLDFALTSDADSRKLQAELAKQKKSPPASPYIPLAVIAERKENPRTTHILRRGDFLDPGPEVQPGTLAVLPPLKTSTPDAAPTRLDLARWLVDPENPLTPRVAANDIWKQLFGRGIVRTVNDFGVRGEPPTHPELLDWLAREYLQLGWSRKALIKRIVMSATYRQSSRNRPELADIDPQNDLFYRQNRFRVEGEIIRDLNLAASGLLSRKIGGPSVYPPMPADIAALSYAGNFRWNTSTGEDRYRRGMYTFFKRTAPHPNLTTFDCPDANTTTVERRTSNTPLQALTTLNNEVYIEAAQGLAKRVLSETFSGDSDRIAYAFRICAARHPSDVESRELLELLDACRSWYGNRAEDAKKLIGSALPAETTVEEAASWVAVSRVLLNLDEFLTRE